VRRLLFVTLLVATFIARPPAARAMDRDLRAVLVAGGYGVLGGTVLGLASYPLTRDTRSIFIGTSVGLYLGLLVGIYFVIDRDSPGNPLRAEAEVPGSAVLPALPTAVAPPPPRLEYTVAHF
jgi:hypothetical protein